jgi:GAF domain-containing protein
MPEDRVLAAVASATLAGEGAHADLLDSIVESARSLFSAKAASIMLFDEETDELVFEAVSGEGSDKLVGARFPATEGVAGWVVTAGQPLLLDDVSGDPRFSREAAESTGYVPNALMAVPLLREDRSLGVLSVLDRADDSAFGLDQMELLELFADQAAIAVDIVQRTRLARSTVEGSTDVAVVARLTRALDGVTGERRDAAVRMLEALATLIDPAGG